VDCQQHDRDHQPDVSGGEVRGAGDLCQELASAQSLPFVMVSKKVGNCDKRMDDKHADYPPSFCFIGNLLINGRINNHPYFKSEKQYSNYNNDWQPCTQVQYMVSIHTEGS
jgi:hypothetical protein